MHMYIYINACIHDTFSSTAQTVAVPRIIQNSGSFLLRNKMAITKLVEWPVVERTPDRCWVLYSGDS